MHPIRLRNKEKSLLRSTPRVAKHFRGEGFQYGTRLPGIRGQASLPARLFEEFLATPSMLHRNLGQQQSTPYTQGHDQAMFADFHLARVDGMEERKDAERHPELLKFVTRDRNESRVLRCGCARRLEDSTVQGGNG